MITMMMPCARQDFIRTLEAYIFTQKHMELTKLLI